MSGDQGKITDQDGIVYEKNWAGHYEPKWDFWAQDYERDKHARTEAYPSETSFDGKPLYRPYDPPQSDQKSNNGSEGSSSGLEAFAVLFLLLALVLIFTSVLVPAAVLIITTIQAIHSEAKRNRLGKALVNAFTYNMFEGVIYAFLLWLMVPFILKFGLAIVMATTPGLPPELGFLIVLMFFAIGFCMHVVTFLVFLIFAIRARKSHFKVARDWHMAHLIPYWRYQPPNVFRNPYDLNILNRMSLDQALNYYTRV